MTFGNRRFMGLIVLVDFTFKIHNLGKLFFVGEPPLGIIIMSRSKEGTLFKKCFTTFLQVEILNFVISKREMSVNLIV